MRLKFYINSLVGIAASLTLLSCSVSWTRSQVTIPGDTNNNSSRNTKDDIDDDQDNGNDNQDPGDDAPALSTCSPTFSTVSLVNPMATGSNDGSTWENAFVDLDLALVTATEGTELWLTAGTYYPSSYNGLDPGSPEDPRLKHFSLKKGVAIIGGFIGVETECAQRDTVLNETILSGDIGEIGNTADNLYHVFYHPTGTNVDATALLDGLTIRDGNANGSGDHNKGAAIFNKGAAPSITNVIFRNNLSSNYAGAIHNEDVADVNIEGSTFIANYAFSRGGAVYNLNSTGQISNSIFQANIADSTMTLGAAICNWNSNFIISDCEFRDHGLGVSDFAFFGGAVCAKYGSLTIEDTLFDHNRGGPAGGALYSSDLNLVVTGCSFKTNTANYDGGAIYAQGASNSVTITDSSFIGNYTTANSNGGGALSLYGLDAVNISNTVLAKNTSNGPGGAVKVDKVDPMVASYLTFYGNKSNYAGVGNTDGGGAIFVYTQSLVNISKSIFWQNLAHSVDRGNNVSIRPGTCTVNIGNSDIEWDAFLTANDLGGNIFADPMFIDVDTDDYHLGAATTCFDMGAFPI